MFSQPNNSNLTPQQASETQTTLQTMPDFTKYRPNAGCVILNAQGKVLYCERADIPGAWQMPQGGIDAGEDAEKAALRELFEETAIKDVTVKGEHPTWLTYDIPQKSDQEKAVKGEFIGQAQKWFLLEYTKADNSIDLTQAQDKEFTNYQWATPEHILATVVAFRKPIYEAVFKHFGLI